MFDKKILIVGDWAYDIYEQAFFDAFVNLGYNNIGKFEYGKYFKYANHPSIFSKDLSIPEKYYYKIQYKFAIGPTLHQLNKRLVTESGKFDVLFLYRCRHIYGKTLKEIKRRKPGIIICSYNNDNPFGKTYPYYVWKHYFNTLKYTDKIFSFRLNNIKDFKQLGYESKMLRAYYREKYNFPDEIITEKKYDVIFIGHFENDGRDKYIKALIDADINIQVFGTGWENSVYYDLFEKKMEKIIPQYGENYNRCLNESKIGLVFLSKKNSDSYTRRNFEIPATRIMMLSEYSDDLAYNLFEEAVDCEYFRDVLECVSKVKYYLENEESRIVISNNGYLKNKTNNEVKERVKEIIESL